MLFRTKCLTWKTHNKLIPSVCLDFFLSVCLSCLKPKFDQLFCLNLSVKKQKTMFGPTFYVLYCFYVSAPCSTICEHGKQKTHKMYSQNVMTVWGSISPGKLTLTRSDTSNPLSRKLDNKLFLHYVHSLY